MIKGKILFTVTLLIALVLTAGAALGGYFAGEWVYETFGTAFTLYDLSMLPVIFASILGGLVFLVALPNVITARQVCRMYNVSRKYAKWSPVTIIVGVLLLLLVGGAIAGVVYLLQTPEAAGVMMILNTLLAQQGLRLADVTHLQIYFGCGIFVFALLLFNPILVALRGRDGVSALLKKKRAHSASEE